MTNTQELRRLARAATPGPWEDVHPNADDEDAVAWKVREPDAAFIAAANPQAVLALLDELDALRAVREVRDREKFNEGVEAALALVKWESDAKAIRALRLPEKEGKE